MDIAEKIRKLKKLKLDIAEMEKFVKEIEDAIKAKMTEQNVSEMVVDVFKIRWIPYSTTRIDMARLKAELPDVALRYSKTTESLRFTIT